ncbi:MAG TPA: alanine--tRNA ligase [Patescibacteria group bacterium]|nr:alanine--tRNA ligase [Patescibacteria group bacterium]
MQSSEIRKKFIEFFKARGHVEIPSAPIVPLNDPSTLFTSSGMQPLVPYLLGQKHPAGTRLVDSQKSFRSQDIDEVGDNRHTTFFEMLGNWSLGDYFKNEQLPWNFEFLTRELGLDPKRLYVTVFEGNRSVPKDTESIEIWKDVFSKVGIEAKEGERIFTYPASKNWWSRSGEPENMPPGEPGGPDSEVFFDFGTPHDESFGKECHPNCDCGRFLEIANSVFMQYQKMPDGSLKELPQKNVDFGGGLERLAAATNDNPDIFQIDFFDQAVKSLVAIKKSGSNYKDDPKPYRIIVDHLRAAIFMVAEGVEPSNKERGYVLRRLIRRSMVYSRRLGMTGDEWLPNTFAHLVTPYSRVYPYLVEKTPEINEIITREVDKFRKTIEGGIKALKKIFGRAIGGVDPENLPPGMKLENNIIRVDGNEVFRIYETYGLTPEIAQEIMTGWGLAFSDETMNECQMAMKKHQELSRTAAAGMFKGGLADQSEATTKLHTAHHLLLAALQKRIDPSIKQRGSNITSERLRIDVSFPRKFTPEELKKVEDLVNEKIQENIAVTREEMDKSEAEKIGAQMEFGTKYPDRVSVYFIGNKNDYFSAEFCGGPHAGFTGSLGRFTITKEDASGAGVRRLYATLH